MKQETSRFDTVMLIGIVLVTLGAAGCAIDNEDPDQELAIDQAALSKIDLSSSLTLKEHLGKNIFFDKRLSSPKGQACAVCHGLEVGTTGPDSEVNLETVVYPGAVAERFGNRKPPSAAYASFSPVFYLDAEKGYVGGQFWDGRAATLADQAKGPFLNPVEQNNPDKAAVVKKIQEGSYGRLFQKVYGDDAFTDIDRAYDFAADAIASYEASSSVNSFSSKYDFFLAGRALLSLQEEKGLALFNGKGRCSVCHPSSASDGSPPLFTDFTYDNLGIPKNPNNPFYFMPESINPAGTQFVDRGLGPIVNDTAQNGKFKVPTLRNVDKRPYEGFVKAFGHNGYFKTLKSIVHFYNTRDIPGLWPVPEVSETVNHQDLGDLQLSSEEENAIVAFLKTLSDGYRAGKLK
jgi:cytochrome c peroxidase